MKRRRKKRRRRWRRYDKKNFFNTLLKFYFFFKFSSASNYFKKTYTKAILPCSLGLSSIRENIEETTRYNNNKNKQKKIKK